MVRKFSGAVLKRQRTKIKYISDQEKMPIDINDAVSYRNKVKRLTCQLQKTKKKLCVLTSKVIKFFGQISILLKKITLKNDLNENIATLLD